eukprot:7186454-Alexandrium_andersonii.AAC.1
MHRHRWGSGLRMAHAACRTPIARRESGARRVVPHTGLRSKAEGNRTMPRQPIHTRPGRTIGAHNTVGDIGAATK